MAESMITPMIIASGCSHIIENPAMTPRYRLPASEPPPSVIALWSQPGPDSLTNAPRVARNPLFLASTISCRSAAMLSGTAACAGDDGSFDMRVFLLQFMRCWPAQARGRFRPAQCYADSNDRMAPPFRRGGSRQRTRDKA
ncbi:MAG: hypothetical protein BWZ10_01612 [candidate division BRC1 bacterium ADurb.BinA364]|nr:MAG: hypothetical protein BWZ10_01612 [candidate division BRC1 bacterium ADurb.BinA364]